MATYSFDQIPQLVGAELGNSGWYEMSQSRINQFAECTEDRQWIHVDVERARSESPFGGTIAHGFLGLSLLAPAHEAIGVYPHDAKQVVNYGLDKVRFMAPVPAGSKLRVRVHLVSAEEKSPGRVLFKTSNTLEIEGSDQPVMIAESLAMVMA